jgi:hypothetical protein
VGGYEVTRLNSRTILAALRSGAEQRILEVMTELTNEIDDHVWNSVLYYKSGNGMLAKLELSKARGNISELEEMIMKALGGEDDPEDD